MWCNRYQIKLCHIFKTNVFWEDLTFHFINCSQMPINECILEQQVVILWSSGCRWLLQGRTSSQVAWTLGNTIMSVVVAALVSTRCRMDTKRSRLKKNDQQPAAASSPPKPVKLQIYKEPWLLLSLDSKPAPELLWFQNLPPGHFYTICSHWSWSEASLGKTKN